MSLWTLTGFLNLLEAGRLVLSGLSELELQVSLPHLPFPLHWSRDSGFAGL